MSKGETVSPIADNFTQYHPWPCMTRSDVDACVAALAAVDAWRGEFASAAKMAEMSLTSMVVIASTGPVRAEVSVPFGVILDYFRDEVGKAEAHCRALGVEP